MMEDQYLDTFMEDQISGPDFYDAGEWSDFDDGRADYEAMLAEEEAEFARGWEEEEDGVADPEPREDFGWFGEAGLWD